MLRNFTNILVSSYFSGEEKKKERRNKRKKATTPQPCYHLPLLLHPYYQESIRLLKNSTTPSQIYLYYSLINGM
jgi:hypothetical protein